MLVDGQRGNNRILCQGECFSAILVRSEAVCLCTKTANPNCIFLRFQNLEVSRKVG